MSLRVKILLSFVLGELLLLTFFGYTAYDTAKITNINNEVALLSSVTTRIADHVAHNINRGEKMNPLLAPYESDGASGATYLFVVDQNGTLIAQPDKVELQHAFQEIRRQFNNTFSHGSGSAEVNGSIYIWATTPVLDTGYSATLVRPALISQAKLFFREMGVSLIVAAVIMLWVASWAAMYVSMLIEKLDEQKNILAHRSLHDVLTGLPNRALLNDRLSQLIDVTGRQVTHFAICFIDLNRFKDVNDTLGHHVGDELLLEVSKRLKAHLRKSDTVARLGGDEFALILREVDAAGARLTGEKILQSIKVPIEIGDHKLFVSGSMGVAMYPDQGREVQLLLRKADVAMYAAKRSGTAIEFYRDDYDVFTQDKLELTQQLHEAIESNQLELWYQPKYDIKDKKVIGAEALLRWNHPVLGYIPPPTFIQVAEHSGLINELSRWVLKKAFCDSEVMDKQGFALSISINLSAYNLQDPRFESDVISILDESGIDARKIILELTESAMVINPSQTKELLIRLTDRGFRISVDDFGTGYSTLTNLRRLPISELKMDRSFVGNIISDVGDASIVNAMIGLGESLEIDVVAEGVETPEVLEALRKSGCFTVQGYLISKPLPLTTMMDWLKLNESRLGQRGSIAV